MAKRRTKKQKKQARHTGVPERTRVEAERPKAPSKQPKKRSSVPQDPRAAVLLSYLKKDLLHTFFASVLVLIVLFGFYLYLR